MLSAPLELLTDSFSDEEEEEEPDVLPEEAPEEVLEEPEKNERECLMSRALEIYQENINL